MLFRVADLPGIRRGNRISPRRCNRADTGEDCLSGAWIRRNHRGSSGSPDTTGPTSGPDSRLGQLAELALARRMGSLGGRGWLPPHHARSARLRALASDWVTSQCDAALPRTVGPQDVASHDVRFDGRQRAAPQLPKEYRCSRSAPNRESPRVRRARCRAVRPPGVTLAPPAWGVEIHTPNGAHDPVPRHRSVAAPRKPNAGSLA